MSNRITGYIFAFSLGAAIGSAVSWKILNTKFEELMREEVDAFREALSARKNEDKESEKEPERPEEPKNIYADIVKSEGYTDYSGITKNEKGGAESMTHEKPYVIAPEDFGENEEYETISLTYYADGVLTDDRDDPMDNVDEIVGLDSLKHFGEYEDDSVFVRNDLLKTDYEILLVQETYSSNVTRSPHKPVEE